MLDNILSSPVRKCERGAGRACIKGKDDLMRQRYIETKKHSLQRTFPILQESKTGRALSLTLTSHELISRTESRSSGLDPVIRLILSQQANPCEERDSKHNLAQGDTTARINI